MIKQMNYRLPPRFKRLFKLYDMQFSLKVTSKPNFKILGIETSCDDTGCAVIDHEGRILGEALCSQNLIHLRSGGINPIVARELHRENIDDVVKAAIGSNISIKDIDAVAVTVKPGLLASLEIGVKYANYLARKFNKPLLPIHHMEAHALAVRMSQNIPFPFIVLLISGGHSLLALVQDVDKFLLLGESLDNAPGEIFDKVARRMKLRNIPEYSTLPGGVAIEMAAAKAINPYQFKFPVPLLKDRDCNFSFSGIKDFAERKVLEKETEHGIMGGGIIPEANNLCGALQLAVAEHLAHRTERAAKFCIYHDLIPLDRCNIVVSGGVASNNFIFKSIVKIGNKLNFKVHRPPPKLCTDNGVMIAWNGLEKFKIGSELKPRIDQRDIEPKSPLGINFIDKVKEANIQVSVTRLKKLYSHH